MSFRTQPSKPFEFFASSRASLAFSRCRFVATVFVATTFVAPVLGGCSRKDEPAPTRVKTDAPVAPALEAPRAPSGSPQGGDVRAQLLWTVPADWKEQPAKPMRKATYHASGNAGSAEIAVFYFGAGEGGGIEANIARWIGQFQGLPADAAKRSENKVGDLTVHEVRVEKGTYASGMPGGPAESQDGWGMRAAVVETPAGNYFFKLLGPGQTVDEQEANFTALLQSLQFK